MAQEKESVNYLGLAPLTNVALCMDALEAAVNRPAHLPGITVFAGPSGFGKSSAAAVAATRFDAVYVQARSTWTRKAAHQFILKEMGVAPGRTLAEMAEQVAEQLALSRRPLILDECDYLLKNDSIEIVRDMYEGSGAAIMLIGEEKLPASLKRWERFHGRILRFVAAEPVSLEDARAMAKLYAGGVDIADDLLARIHREAKGSARRVCVNIERARKEAAGNGLTAIDLAAWGNRPLYTGEAPARRL